MVDIAKCNGFGCPVKERCYRYTVKDGFTQWYNTFEYKNGCDYFYYNKKHEPIRKGNTN